MARNNGPAQPRPVPIEDTSISRSDFPAGFIFGAGTSAYQVEGATFEGGKSLNVWDDMSFGNPSAITDGSNGSVACDMYHRYKEDIANMKKMGFDSYRFSIAWSRILPGGRLSAGGVNREAVNYYNDLIDTVIANGMIPMATIFHFDLPSCLQKEYGGFLSKRIVDDFTEYAGVCFWEFGDRVKYWATINEPYTYCTNGYVMGVFPPGEVATTPENATKFATHKVPDSATQSLPAKTTKTKYSDVKYDKSDPARDVYTVARHILLAHSAAVQLYRTKYQAFQEGQIGIVLNSHMFEPFDEKSEADKAAAARAFDFCLGWFLEPVLYGRYPQSMIANVPPENFRHFSKHEEHMLRGSSDYIGLNYYTSYYVKDAPDLQGEGYDADQKLTFAYSRNGKLIGEQVSAWQYVVPRGLYGLLMHIKNTYSELPPIYITENGVPQTNDPKQTIAQATVDPIRIKFYQDHLSYLLKAIKEKVDVRGYYIWAYCDNFEWSDGYYRRFGIMYVDFLNKQARYPKHSALWFAGFLKAKKKLIAIAHEREVDEQNDLVANANEA